MLQPYRAALDVNDLVLFVWPLGQDLHVLRAICGLFEGVSGLGCNIIKCQMAPIRCSEDQTRLATSIFSCQLVNFPIRYLGTLLSVSKLPMTAFQPLIDHMDDKLLVWKGRLLHRSGGLVLIKTTLTMVPIHITIKVELPPRILKAVQKIMMMFLRSGSDEGQCGKCLVAWNQVQPPLHLGGLDVINLW
jgi:hypothetical protein